MPPTTLICEPLAEAGVDHLRAHLDVRDGVGKSREEILAMLEDVEGVVIRSKTKLDREAIARAKNLKAIGRAGVGYDNVDVEAANERGVLVMNVPEGNTLAAAEHTVALLLSLLRNIPRADAAMKAGRWDRGKFMGTQLSGKTLGVVGFGKIGYQVARRLAAFDMKIVVYDPYAPPERLEALGARRVELDELFADADVVTLHAPNNEATRGMINAKTLAKMRPSAVLVNCARGNLVDSEALLAALEGGQIAGAALDVFPAEPLDEGSPLRAYAGGNLVLTPHLGASTREAQAAVGEAIAEQMVAALLAGEYPNAVNLPPVGPEELEELRPYMKLATQLGALFAKISPQLLGEVMVSLEGGLTALNQEYLRRSVLVGMLGTILDQPVTHVNAPLLAQQRHLSLTVLEKDRPKLFTHRLTLAAGPRRVSGVLSPSNAPTMVELDGFDLDLQLEGAGLLIKHHDKPGVIGRVGTLLAEHGVNISRMDVGRKGEGSEARMAIAVDGYVGAEIVAALETLPDVEGAVGLNF